MELVKAVIGEELSSFEKYFREAFKSDALLLDKILQYLNQQKGKQMRPMFVLLCAKLGGIINNQSFRAALVVEMLHTSSLVHDDIVDDSMLRRGAYSVNALWKNQASVLTGNVLFSKSISLLLNNDDHKTLEIFSASIKKVIEGELLQIGKSKKLNFDEDVYYEIINGKTATLLAAACEAGAASTFTDEAEVKKLYEFGENMGIAFQIKDDLFDYGKAEVGKPTRNDIKEKKLTLPLIHTLKHCDKSMRRKLIRIVKYKNTDDASVDYLVEQVEQHGGMTYAEEKMLEYREKSLTILREFPPSETRDALEQLVKYTTDRAK